MLAACELYGSLSGKREYRDRYARRTPYKSGEISNSRDKNSQLCEAERTGIISQAALLQTETEQVIHLSYTFF